MRRRLRRWCGSGCGGVGCGVEAVGGGDDGEQAVTTAEVTVVAEVGSVVVGDADNGGNTTVGREATGWVRVGGKVLISLSDLIFTNCNILSQSKCGFVSDLVVHDFGWFLDAMRLVVELDFISRNNKCFVGETVMIKSVHFTVSTLLIERMITAWLSVNQSLQIMTSKLPSPMGIKAMLKGILKRFKV
uniref:Uncharacterized protein n=1 Tax=Tanacetum cinerariifolium TaxID=118510 RepID=A0A6L2MH83_TANCI|nr:hypothetical protein [Tanacetum cinerariifolium]